MSRRHVAYPLCFAGLLASGLCLATCCPKLGAGEKPKASEPVAAPAVTVTHLDKLEKEEFPWGWICWMMNAKINPDAAMTFGVVEIKPHQSNPVHLHPDSEEILYVVSGSCEHRVGDRVDLLKAGDVIRIPPGRPHMARTLDEPVRVIVVYNTGERKFVPVDESPRAE
jgi:quercetin dioxygenase-like cupin family protein